MLRRSYAWHGRPPLLAAPGLGAPRRGIVQWAGLQRVMRWVPGALPGGYLRFLHVVINDSKQSSTFRRSGTRGRALAGRGSLGRLCRHHPCSGWPSSHWPLAGDPVIGGRHRAIVIFIAAGVSITPSSVIRRRVYPHRVLHAGR